MGCGVSSEDAARIQKMKELEEQQKQVKGELEGKSILVSKGKSTQHVAQQEENKDEGEEEEENSKPAGLATSNPDDPFAEVDLSQVTPETKEQILSMLAATKEHCDSSRCAEAADEITKMMANVNTGGDNDNGTLVAVAGFLQVAADMQGPACAAISATLIEVGKHLPFIGVAVGALGFMIGAFNASKVADQNLKVIVIWMTGVGEWLKLVSDQIDGTASDNTVEMFETLSNQIQEMQEATNNYKKNGRFKKMFTNASFTTSFGRAKETVTLIKTELRDLLDLKQQNRQEE